MNILVTGGAGYIASKLIGYLLNLDSVAKVSAFDNLLYDEKSLLSYVDNPKFNFIKGDVRNKFQLLNAIKDADIIFPLAALVGASLCDKNPIDAVLVNYESIKLICDNKSKDQKIIFCTTNSGYGSTDGSIMTEDNDLNPISLYGKTKVDAEKAVSNTENHIITRLATVFGCGLRPRCDLLVNNLVLRALKDKIIVLYESEYMRNYIHLKDICRSLIHLMNEKYVNNTYNVGNDSINMSKMQLCSKIKEHLPLEIIKANYTKDPDQRNYLVSSKKLYDTGFNCEYDLDYGIKELIKMYEIIDKPVNSNY